MLYKAKPLYYSKGHRQYDKKYYRNALDYFEETKSVYAYFPTLYGYIANCREPLKGGG